LNIDHAKKHFLAPIPHYFYSKRSMNSKPLSSISELVFGELQALQIAPKRLTEINSWHGHIPFAFWLVKKLEPSVFIELGVHKGDSYSAFCQAVQLFSLDTACYGVDTWKEDTRPFSCGCVTKYIGKALCRLLRLLARSRFWCGRNSRS
jgi:hypothetical protein